MRKRFYVNAPPGIDSEELKGTLVVLEGGDGAGRSTQTALLKDWLERLGYPTAEVGLKRSELVGKELMEVMTGNVLSPITLSLFYVTDFADQLENAIIPALRAGFVVIADRYVYTLLARNIARGVSRNWLRDVCGIAVIPDLIFYLKVNPRMLAERLFQKSGRLDYWESGMDIERSGDMFQCFISYQTRIAREFDRMASDYGFITVDGERDVLSIQQDLQDRLKRILKKQGSSKSALLPANGKRALLQPKRKKKPKKAGKRRAQQS